MSGTAAFLPGQTTQTVRVNLNDNASVAALNYFTFTIYSPTGATILRGTQTIDIVPNGSQVATPALFVRDAVTDSYAPSVEVPVMLGGAGNYDQPSNNTITVDYTTRDVSAVAGTDYGPTSGTLTFPPGETVQNITIPILHNPARAPDRRFAVTLSHPSNATVAAATGVVTIGASGATATNLPGVSLGADVVVGAGDGYVDLPISLSAPLAPGSQTVAVAYATTSGTAQTAGPNYEYNAMSGTAAFLPGQTTLTVRVNLNDNASVAALNYFTFTIYSPTGATILRGTQTIDIVPDSFVAVDAESSVLASIPSVPANGVAQSTITVTLKGGNGVALPSKIVTLAPNAGAQATISPASLATDGNGQATFYVSDVTVEHVIFTAKDETDALTLTHAASVSFTTPPAQGGEVPLPPTRVLDTRDGTGDTVGPVGAGQTVSLSILRHGGVPGSGVAAVVLNVTVTAPTSAGYITVYPDGVIRPLASNLNFSANETVPNLVIAPVKDSKVDFYNGSGGTVQLIADVSGWYASGSAGAGGLTPVTPTRVLDTRDGTGGAIGPVAAGKTVSLPMAVPGSGVAAVVLNVTVTAPTGAGYITVYPDGVTRPLASNLNFSANETIGNLVIVPVGLLNGRVDFYNGSGGTVQLVADVSGRYASGSAGVGGLTPVTPARVLDTRYGTGAPVGPVGAGQTVSLSILGHGGVPGSGVAAVVLNVTVTAPTSGGYISVYPDGVTRPLASNLNFSANETVPNLVIAPVGADGRVDFYNGSGGSAHLIADVSGWFSS
jgi:hypothetical protein